MFFKRMTACIVTLALVLGFTACSKQSGNTPAPGNGKGFTMPYVAADSLDPYTCKDEGNQLLCKLIYEPLFYINLQREPVNVLAQKYMVEENTITVTINPMQFSDGSEISADDVVYSFHRAKQSEKYKDALSVFSEVQRKGSGVVRFILAKDDVYAVNLLTFPIVSQKDNSLGTGYYALEKNDEGSVLVYNKNHEGAKPKLDTITLLECSGYHNAPKLFQEEKIDYLFEHFDDTNIRTSALNTQVAKLNNLVFLGLNANKGLFGKTAFRDALNHSINQSELCKEAMEGYGVPTATPFDAAWSEIGSIVSNSILSNKANAKAAFAKAACTYDKMGISLQFEEKPITLGLIVNSANNMKIALAEQIKTQLMNCGISVEVKKMPLDEYNVAIENGNFDMYIGEVKIEDDFNFDCFFTKGGGADFGITGEKMNASYAAFRSGEISLQDFVSAFCEENPFIPICYKCANVCIGAGIQNEGEICENIPFPQIEEWSR